MIEPVSGESDNASGSRHEPGTGTRDEGPQHLLTARVHTLEAALKRSEARYGALCDASLWPSFTLDRRGVVRAVSACGARELGYEQSELVGMPLYAFLDERDRPSLRKQLEIVAASRDAIVSRDLRHLRKDGSAVWTRGSLRFMRQAEGDARFLLVCKDVSELKATEQRLQMQRGQLSILTRNLGLAEERERRRIAAGLHDEVGHSLALAQIQLGTLGEKLTAELRLEMASVRELIAEVIKTTRALTFDLSSPVLYELGLVAALESAADRLAEATGIDLEFVSDGKPASVSEDTGVLLFRSVREILLNVAKHAGAQTATLSVHTLADELQIRVADDGVGFDAANVMRPAGTGIGHGLRSATEHVQSVGGSLEVDAAPGFGTTCLIVVPLGS